MDSHFQKIISHIEFVQRNMQKLAERVPSSFGKKLYKNSYLHDNSKLSGFELKYLNEETRESKPDFFYEALQHHRVNNPHHVEFWGDIHEMPQIYIAELVCDCVARGQELCTNTSEWFSKTMPERYEFTEDEKVYHDIQKYFALLKETL